MGTMLTLLSLRQMALKANMASVYAGTGDMKAQCTLWIHESKSAVVVRRKFIMSKHPHWRNKITSRKVTRTWYSRFTESGHIYKGNEHRGRPLVGPLNVDYEKRESFTGSDLDPINADVILSWAHRFPDVTPLGFFFGVM